MGRRPSASLFARSDLALEQSVPAYADPHPPPIATWTHSETIMYQGMVFLQDLEQTMELLAEVAVHAQYTEEEVRVYPVSRCAPYYFVVACFSRHTFPLAAPVFSSDAETAT